MVVLPIFWDMMTSLPCLVKFPRCLIAKTCASCRCTLISLECLIPGNIAMQQVEKTLHGLRRQCRLILSNICFAVIQRFALSVLCHSSWSLALLYCSFCFIRNFNAFEVKKCWKAFLKESEIYPLQPTAATMHFNFQLGEPWAAFILIFFCIFSFKKLFSLHFGTVCFGPTKHILLLWDSYEKSINLFFSLANALRKVFYCECFQFWKFKANCPTIFSCKISI